MSRAWDELTEAERVRIFTLWSELDAAMIQSPELFDEVEPWGSTNPRVIAAWEALTRPENLSYLEAWYARGDYGQIMNPFAASATREAIRACRSRVG